MTTLEDLIAYHEIAQVKYRYLRALDSHDWDLMKTCFTEDARAWYSGGKYSTEGRDEIIQLLRDIIPDSFIGSHVIMHPELEITGRTSARGIWRPRTSSISSTIGRSTRILTSKAARRWWARAIITTNMKNCPTASG